MGKIFGTFTEHCKMAGIGSSRRLTQTKKIGSRWLHVVYCALARPETMTLEITHNDLKISATTLWDERDEYILAQSL